MNAATYPNHPKRTFPTAGLLLLAALIALTYAVTASYSPPPDLLQDNRAKMEQEKSSGKHGKHANTKAREKAQQEYEKVRDEYQQMNRKPNKTPDEKKLIEKLRKKLEHLRKKKDFSGEHHSQKPKGN